jgi:hypothetical protein
MFVVMKIINMCFRRAHTLTVLIVLVIVLIYVAVFESVKQDTSYNTKRFVIIYIKEGI